MANIRRVGVTGLSLGGPVLGHMRCDPLASQRSELSPVDWAQSPPESNEEGSGQTLDPGTQRVLTLSWAAVSSALHSSPQWLEWMAGH